MIFKQVHEIACGLKTQTRRVVKQNETAAKVAFGTPLEFMNIGEKWGDAVAVRFGNTYRQRIKWQVGRDYAVVPKRGASTFLYKGLPLRIKLLSIRREALQSITEADAQAEGVPDVKEYRRLWESINTRKGTRWDDNPDVWVLTFKLAK